MKTDYSKLILTPIVDKRVTFWHCIYECGGNREFREQLDRLFKLHLKTVLNSNGINKMIDEATGFTNSVMQNFVALCWYLVWTRLPRESIITTPEFEIELAKKYQPILDKLMKD